MIRQISNKPRLLLTIATILIAAQSTLAAGRIIDQIIWIVGDEPIMQSEVEAEKMRMRYEKEQIKGDPYCVIPEQIAIQKLFIAQAKLDSIEVSDNTVNQQVDARINYFIQRIGSKEKAEEYFGKPINKMREDIERTVRDQMMMQQMQQKIIGDTKVSPAEVSKFYRSLPKDSIPMIPEQVEVQIITIAPEVTLAEEERVRAQLREFREKIESGESQFSTLAILYSEDRMSALQGGELGFMTRGKLVPEFANVAFSLYDPTKVSRIVKSEFGYHIIQLIERKADQVNCRHILITPKIGLEQKNQAYAKLDSITAEIRLGNITFAAAALEYSEDKNTQQNEGNMINQNDGSTKFQLKDLPSEVAKAVYTLEVGEISKPFYYKDEKGHDVVSIVRLKNRIKSHKANPDDDFQALREMVVNARNKELIEEWIKRKQKEIYIHIEPDFRNCDFQYPGWIK